MPPLPLTMSRILSRRSRFHLVCAVLITFFFVSYVGSSKQVTPNGPSLQPLAATSPPYDAEKNLGQSALGEASLAPIPVIIFAFNRPNHLRLTIDSVIAALGLSSHLYPIFISQDGYDPAVEAVIASYGSQVTHLRYAWRGTARRADRKVYLKIAGHYQFALNQVMDVVDGHDRWDRVIMLEDDMYVSPDFFSYFRRMSPLFDSDPTLYCVSAWNSNGQERFVSSPTAVYRTEFFPGLGWMWSRSLWNELHEWTRGYWDDWLSEPAQRKGRSCIYPEINRAYTFGDHGASGGWGFKQYMKGIRLNMDDVDWNGVNISHVQAGRYDEWLLERLQTATPVNEIKEARTKIDHDLVNSGEAVVELSERRIGYRNRDHLQSMLLPNGMMAELKSNMVRTSYKGIVHFRHRGIRVWLVPNDLNLSA